MRNWRAWVLAATVFAITVWIVQSSHTFQECVQEHRQHYTSKNFEERVTNFTRSAGVRKVCVGEFIHKNGEGITAAFTVVLAISTILLWLATKKLWDAGERQIRTSRQIAALQARQTRASLRLAERTAERQEGDTEILQRAYISVEPHGIHEMLDMRAVLGHVAIKNAGNLPATALSWSIKIKDSTSGDDASFPLDAGKGNIVVSPRSESVRGSESFVGIDELNDKCGTNDGRGRGQENPVFIYVWGVVRYHDGFVEGRETTFCHRYNWINRGRVPGQGYPSSGNFHITPAFARVHEHGNGAT